MQAGYVNDVQENEDGEEGKDCTCCFPFSFVLCPLVSTWSDLERLNGIWRAGVRIILPLPSAEPLRVGVTAPGAWRRSNHQVLSSRKAVGCAFLFPAGELHLSSVPHLD